MRSESGKPRVGQGSNVQRGFTLVELILAMGIAVLLLVLLMQMLSFSSRQWKSMMDNTRAFETARVAFDAITKTLSNATLDVSYDYYDQNRVARLDLTTTAALASFEPDVYGRYSNLHFVAGRNLVSSGHTHAVFFQAPLGYDPVMTESSSDRLNAVGYFIRYETDQRNRPSHLTASNPRPKPRFRLYEYRQPTRKLDVYRAKTNNLWFASEVNAFTGIHQLAENIVALIIEPRWRSGTGGWETTPGYSYDTRMIWPAGFPQPPQMHQLPSVIRVTMIAIDEATAERNPGLGQGFQQLFTNSAPDVLEDDLEAVYAALRSVQANYRTFQTEIPVRSAKWSQ